MADKKETGTLDEDTLPDYLLTPDSIAKKQRENRETNLLIDMELVRLSIILKALHSFLATQQQSIETLHTESLRHLREIESFFKNLAGLDENSNLKIQLKNMQLDQLKSILEKLNQAINKIDDTLKNIAVNIKNAEDNLFTKNQQLNKYFERIEEIFSKCNDQGYLENFDKFSIDLKELTGKDLGKFEINKSNFQTIVNEVHKEFQAQHPDKGLFDFKNCLLDKLANHVEIDVTKRDTKASIDKNHPALNYAAEELIKRMGKAASCDASQEFDLYKKDKESRNMAENDLEKVKAEYDIVLQQKNTLSAARDSTRNMLQNGKADLPVFGQFTSSIDSLIKDVTNILDIKKPSNKATHTAETPFQAPPTLRPGGH